MTDIIQHWTTQVPDGISISLYKLINPENEEEVAYTAELAFFLEPFDDEPEEVEGETEKKVFIMSTDIFADTQREAIEKAAVAMQILYEGTYLSPIVLVFSIDEEGNENIIEEINLEEFFSEEVEEVTPAKTKKPKTKI